MIPIYRSRDYDCEMNFFHGRDWVKRDEVVVKTKKILRIFSSKNLFGGEYTYAEPSVPGNYAFGGTILFASNGIYPEFSEPLKLHDRRMDLEVHTNLD